MMIIPSTSEYHMYILIIYIYIYIKLYFSYTDYETSYTTGTDVCVRMIFVWEETECPEETHLSDLVTT